MSTVTIITQCGCHSTDLQLTKIDIVKPKQATIVHDIEHYTYTQCHEHIIYTLISPAPSDVTSLVQPFHTISIHPNSLNTINYVKHHDF